jgi:hypothetical protein
MAGKIADTLNDIIDTKARMVREVTEVSRVVGREGRLTQRAEMPTPPAAGPPSSAPSIR